MSRASSAGEDKALTILLTLKGRPAFTFRWMSWAEQVRLPFKVLIADGGSDEEVPAVLSDRARFPAVDYDYIRYPNDAAYSDYYRKICDALTRVTTPFVALADNDDFFIVEGLRDATRFLLSHPDYVTCGGRIARFWLASRTTDGADPVYAERVDYKYGCNDLSVTADRARERVVQRTEDTYYNVKRTDELRRQFETVVGVDPKDLFLYEHLLECLTLIAGKACRLPGLYLARQWNTGGSSAIEHEERFGDAVGRMLVPTWSEDFGKFLDVTSARLSQADSIPLAEARRLMVKAYRIGVAPNLLANVLDEPSVTPAMPFVLALVRRIVRLAPDSAIRSMARTVFRRLPWFAFDLTIGEKFFSGKSPSEFEPIARFLVRDQRQQAPGVWGGDGSG